MGILLILQNVVFIVFGEVIRKIKYNVLHNDIVLVIKRCR
jgi:hypothetical protein